MTELKYGNFVKPSSSVSKEVIVPRLDGNTARRLYLEEVKHIADPLLETDEVEVDRSSKLHDKVKQKPHKVKQKPHISTADLTDRDLFISAQNNDKHTLVQILDNMPNKINQRDEYGWSLLMIACQANSVDVVRELLRRNVDTDVRDKAGNSARSLVINNKNFVLADILLSHKTFAPTACVIDKIHKRVKLKKDYPCDVCKKTFKDKQQHLSSTLHNLNASKDKKVPTAYVIPESNRGYQIMLRRGWNRDDGLGPEGTGKKYPIRTVQKKDRKGLGHGKIKKSSTEEVKDTVKIANKKLYASEQNKNRRMEIDFRRQFY